VLEYDLPADLSSKTSWLESYNFDKFEALVLSMSQIEYILAHR
jgi:hypothetical protein